MMFKRFINAKKAKEKVSREKFEKFWWRNVALFEKNIMNKSRGQRDTPDFMRSGRIPREGSDQGKIPKLESVFNIPDFQNFMWSLWNFESSVDFEDSINSTDFEDTGSHQFLKKDSVNHRLSGIDTESLEPSSGLCWRV